MNVVQKFLQQRANVQFNLQPKFTEHYFSKNYAIYGFNTHCQVSMCSA